MCRYVRIFVGFALGLFVSGSASAMGTSVFFNEIHYDNTGTDAGEAIEIAGAAGMDLTGWTILLYNGNGGALYNTYNLSGLIPDLQNGFGVGFVTYGVNGIQNGSPDGFALVDPTNTVVQFLSYEGTFAAVGGAADGLMSTDIGVFEDSSTPLGYSLQLQGTGSTYEDFTWAGPAQNTFGSINTNQMFVAPVPEPASLSLLGLGLASLAGAAIRRRKR